MFHKVPCYTVSPVLELSHKQYGREYRNNGKKGVSEMCFSGEKISVVSSDHTTSELLGPEIRRMQITAAWRGWGLVLALSQAVAVASSGFFIL